MIPHASMDHEIFADGLRKRIAACRKRLRNTRSAREPRVYAEQEAFSETTNGSQLPGHRAEFSMTRMSVSLIDYSSQGFESTQARDSESLVLVGEQEVGIT